LRVLTKYFCKEFFMLLSLVLTISLSIYLIIEFVQRLYDFLGVHAPMRVMFLFFLYKTPFIITQMLPVSTLIAIIVMFSLMKKNNEITAMKACGISIFEIAKPVIFVSK